MSEISAEVEIINKSANVEEVLITVNMLITKSLVDWLFTANDAFSSVVCE